MPSARARVYIPNLNGGAMLLEMLESLAAQTLAVDAVLVDNGSDDGSAERAEREHPGITVLRLGSNHGFGPALNAAVRAHPAEILIFSNNDVRFEPRFVEAMLDELGGAKATVAGVLLQGDDPRLIDSAGVVVDKTLLAFDYLHAEPLEALRGAPPPLGPTGGAALVPFDQFSAAGGFDERIFAYLEDVDLALRLRMAGVSCRLAREARAVHRHSATLGSGSSAKNRLMGWSRGYMLRRYGVLSSPLGAARALAAETIICAGQIAIDRNAAGVKSRLQGWRAAKDLERLATPPRATLDIGLAQALRRRARRRVPKSPASHA